MKPSTLNLDELNLPVYQTSHGTAFVAGLILTASMTPTPKRGEARKQVF
jgi:hypothetical protein